MRNNHYLQGEKPWLCAAIVEEVEQKHAKIVEASVTNLAIIASSVFYLARIAEGLVGREANFLAAFWEKNVEVVMVAEMKFVRDAGAGEP
jgi:hypothetical protein